MQWRRRSDGGQRPQVALQLGGRLPARAFEAGAQIAFADAGVAVERAEPGGEHLTEHRVLFQLGHNVRARDAVAGHHDGFIQQLRWNDLVGLQADKPLDDERQTDDGTGNQRPNGPSSGLYDRKQIVAPVVRQHLAVVGSQDYGLPIKEDSLTSVRRQGRQSKPPFVDNFVYKLATAAPTDFLQGACNQNKRHPPMKFPCESIACDASLTQCGGLWCHSSGDVLCGQVSPWSPHEQRS
jgi:hypothetical protein